MIGWLLLLALSGDPTWSLVEARRGDASFQLPLAPERERYAALVRDLARAAAADRWPPDAAARAEALGFELRIEGEVAWLGEREGMERGAGLVALRRGPLDGELVLQAPHPFYDLNTGRIVSRLFDEGGVRAAVIATAHRRAAPGSDAAHQPHGYFQAATDGLAAGLRDPLVVQVHGFGSGTTGAEAVVSEGATRVPAEDLRVIAARLGRALELEDVRLGAEVPALAARRNVQGRLLADRARFLHLELGGEVRQRLTREQALRERFRQALAEVATRRLAEEAR